MKSKRQILIVLILCVGIPGLFIMVVYRSNCKKIDPEDMFERLEKAMGDEAQKLYKTELAATMEYGNKDGTIKAYLRILKSTYYESDPSEITGLHTDALNVLFPVEYMDSCEKMKIQEWDAALYKKEDKAYLCWTYSPEVTYVLEYNPNLIEDAEIIKTAESARVDE